ncbi:hypothetical protein FVE85_4485 [Porphyridium purpureum]|uniref:Plastid lipid-associated protein/fibrillin conserved domain-containing protein n=1 Tax=Porphyridium purpureum TaxID=35688 RepID=A0A5J4YIK4_PORPP|nr:hypothetical protein FVE85_4485 [Porphyridium purpureum]|eukprot:POR8995..scf297_16
MLFVPPPVSFRDALSRAPCVPVMSQSGSRPSEFERETERAARAVTVEGAAERGLRRARYMNPDAVKAARAAKETVKNERQRADLRNLEYLPAKEELLNLLPGGAVPNTTPSELLVQVRTLEMCGNLPNSQVFCELALAGQWSLAYSSSVPIELPHDAGVSITRMQQVLDLAAGKLTHIIDYIDLHASDSLELNGGGTEPPKPVSSGRLLVQCSTVFTSASAFTVKLNEHVLRPSKQAPVRSDVESLVQDIQACIPREVFDPEGAMMVTFVDPQLRVTRLQAADHEPSAGDTIHIYLRSSS